MIWICSAHLGGVTPVDRLHQIALRPVGVGPTDGQGIFVREVVNALERLEMEFHPDALLPGVQE
jgi:hypothetical protein